MRNTWRLALLASAILLSDLPVSAQASLETDVLACAPSEPAIAARRTVSLRVFLSSKWSGDASITWTGAKRGLARTSNGQWTWRASDDIGPQRLVVSVESNGRRDQCALQVLVVPDAARGVEGALALLPAAIAEPSDYGIYTYVLFTQKSSSASVARDEALVGAARDMIPGIAALERYLPRSEVNRVALPIETSLYDVAKDGDVSDLSGQELLRHYDYARARVLLSRLPKQHSGGPYLVSTLRPLSTVSPIEYLIQDLAAIPPPLIRTWFSEFLNQTAQQRVWTSDGVGSLALKLRTILAQVALGYPDVLKSANPIVEWFKK